MPFSLLSQRLHRWTAIFFMENCQRQLYVALFKSLKSWKCHQIGSGSLNFYQGDVHLRTLCSELEENF